MKNFKTLFLIIASFFIGINCGDNSVGDNRAEPYFDLIPSPNLQNGWVTANGPNTADFGAFAISSSRIYASTYDHLYYLDKNNPEVWRFLSRNGKPYEQLGLVGHSYSYHYEWLLYHDGLKKLFSTISVTGGAKLVSVAEGDDEWKIEDEVPVSHNLSIVADDEAVYVLSGNAIYKITDQTEKLYTISSEDALLFAIDPTNKSFFVCFGERAYLDGYVNLGVRINIVDKDGERQFIGSQFSVLSMKYAVDTQTLYVLSEDGLFLTGKENPSWRFIENSEDSHFNSVAVDKDNVYLADDKNNIFSLKENETTQICNSTEIGKSSSHSQISPDFSFMAPDGGKLYFGNFYNLSVCENEKNTYKLTTKGISDSIVLALEFSDVLYAQTPNVFEDAIGGPTYYSVYLMDSSDNWRGSGRNENLPPATTIESPGVSFKLVEGDGVHISYDGTNWGPFNDGLPNLQINALAYDEKRKILYAGTNGNGVFERLLQ